MKLFQVTVLCCIFLSVRSQLRCYDCDPKGDNACKTPADSNVKQTTCNNANSRGASKVKNEVGDVNNLESNPKSGNVTDFHCFSMHFEGNGTEGYDTGVYRGCTVKVPNVMDPCESLQEELAHGKVTICKTCAEDSCNRDGLSGAVGSGTASLVVLLASFFICFYVLYF